MWNLKNILVLAASCVGIAIVPIGRAVDARAPVQNAPSPASRSYDSLVATRPDAATPDSERPIVIVTQAETLCVFRGSVFSTNDAGKDWTRRGAVTGTALSAAVVPNGIRCLLKSGLVAESEDGGRTWKTVLDLAPSSDSTVVCGGFSPTGEPWASVEAPKVGVALGIGSAVELAEGPRARIGSAWRGTDLFVATSRGDVYRGPADGTELKRVVSLQGATLNDIAFADDARGWIATGEGLVLETNDGGTTWLPRPVAGASALDAVGLSGTAFWVVGRAQSDGVVFVSTDHGVRWRNVLKAPAPISRPVAVGAGGFVCVDGAGGVWIAPALDGDWKRVTTLDREQPKAARPKPKPR